MRTLAFLCAIAATSVLFASGAPAQPLTLQSYAGRSCDGHMAGGAGTNHDTYVMKGGRLFVHHMFTAGQGGNHWAEVGSNGKFISSSGVVETPEPGSSLDKMTVRFGRDAYSTYGSGEYTCSPAKQADMALPQDLTPK